VTTGTPMVIFAVLTRTAVDADAHASAEYTKPPGDSNKISNNNNDNNQDNVYGAVIMAEPLREFTRFII